MSDVKCPYCEFEQEINHDDGYGYREDCEHEQECVECKEIFIFNTSISYNYEVECREGDHDMEPFGDKWPHMYQCNKCDFYEYQKPPKNEEA